MTFINFTDFENTSVIDRLDSKRLRGLPSSMDVKYKKVVGQMDSDKRVIDMYNLFPTDTFKINNCDFYQNSYVNISLGQSNTTNNNSLSISKSQNR